MSPDPSKGDFTSLQPAIAALPASGGKIFVKAGVYPLTNTISIKTSNVQIQGEGVGITVFVGASTMTGNTPALEGFSTASDGSSRPLVRGYGEGRHHDPNLASRCFVVYGRRLRAVVFE